MQKERVFKPSLFYRLLKDPFSVWCDYHAPGKEMVEEVSAYELMRQQVGYEYEEKWVKEHYPNAVKIRPDWGFKALENTCRAMLKGVSTIHQASLWVLPDDFCGKADLLVRCDDAPSDLGNYHYRVEEIKNSKEVSEYHRLQVGFYNMMLGKIQGYMPDSTTVALKDKEEQVVFTDDLSREINNNLILWHSIRDGKNKPLPNKFNATASPWRLYANKILMETMDLTLVPDIGPATRDKIIKVLNKNSLTEFHDMPFEQIIDALKDFCDTEAFYYYVQAYKSSKPVIKPQIKLTIPRRQKHLYLDFETSDDVCPTEPPHVYLIGLWDADENKYMYFLAMGAGDEKRIFRELIDYVGDPADTCIYHWASFETETITNEVMVRHPELTNDLQKIVDACIDLKEVVKQQVYVPVPNYSIKFVAPFLGFKWRHKDVDAFQSMVLYWDYLKDKKKKTIQKVLDYNEDDCRAMVHVDKIITEKLMP